VKRPLVSQFEKGQDFRDLQMILEQQMFPRWHERMAYRVSEAFRKAFLGPIRLSTYNTTDAVLTFSNREEIMSRLGLSGLDIDFRNGEIFRLPSDEEGKGHGAHFPQLAAVWEPRDENVMNEATLQVEVGAGFHLVSLKFCRKFSTRFQVPEEMQLDSAAVFKGHNYTELSMDNLELVNSLQILMAGVADVVTHIRQGRMQEADSFLADVADVAIQAEYAHRAERSCETVERLEEDDDDGNGIQVGEMAATISSHEPKI
jgi:hypothetical protein